MGTSKLPPGPPTDPGKWTITISLDMEGIDAKDGKGALAMAIEAITLGLGTFYSEVSFGACAHAMPERGKTEEILIPKKQLVIKAKERE